MFKDPMYSASLNICHMTKKFDNVQLYPDNFQSDVNNIVGCKDLKNVNHAVESQTYTTLWVTTLLDISQVFRGASRSSNWTINQ